MKPTRGLFAAAAAESDAEVEVLLVPGIWTCSRRAGSPRERVALTPRTAVRSGVGFVSGDRANKGTLASLPIIDNILTSRRIVEHRTLVSRSEIGEGFEPFRNLKIIGASLWASPGTPGIESRSQFTDGQESEHVT
jgi:hypothetical protein